MLGAEVIIDILITFGVNQVFGYPGGYALDIYQALAKESSKINHYLAINEQNAVFSADGYARISGNLGVVITTSGPGATNIVTGLATANADSSALLAITGNVPTTLLGSDAFQEVDIFGVTLPITKYNKIVKEKDELAGCVINAINLAKSGRKGAVLLDIPQDIQQAQIDITHQDILDLIEKSKKISLPNLDTKSLDIAIDYINKSSKTVLLCGGGINNSKAYTQVEKLADKLGCPIVTTLMGVNTFDSKKENYFGLCGAFGSPTANHCLKSADTIIALGARFGERLTKNLNLKNKRVIQIDIDKAEHDKNIECICFIKSDLQKAIEYIVEKVNKKENNFIKQMRNHLRKTGCGDNNRKIHGVLAYLSDIANEKFIVSTDVGEHQMAVAKNYKFGRKFLTSGGFGTMGWGLGALIGGLLSDKNSYGLLITGDGSFNMSFNEFANCVKEKLPIIIVIFNNHALGMCKTMQQDQFNNTYMTQLNLNINYKLLAQSMGGYGVYAKNLIQVKKAIESYKYDLPMIIDFDLRSENE